ncbi:MAG TPA: hypothetical protein VKC60_07890 [Opitutaceae bacterium]|nr:hypothetical protein [Opitutaceae bacterium]
MPCYITAVLFLALLATALYACGVWTLGMGVVASFLFGLTMILMLANVIGHSDDKTM